MKDDPQPPKAEKPKPEPAKSAREEALAKALRANLRRRKTPKASEG